MNTVSIFGRKGLPDSFKPTANNILVFGNDKCFLAMLKGYCYVNHIVVTEADFTMDGINEIEKLKLALIIVPLDLLSIANKSMKQTIKRACASGQVKICGLNKNSTNIISAGLSEWIDVIIDNPFDIGEIDKYLKKIFLLDGCSNENRRHRERRSSLDRRSAEDRRSTEFNSNGDNGFKVTSNRDYQHEYGKPGFIDFHIDQRNKVVSLKEHKAMLTHREFEQLLTNEIINILWPENNLAKNMNCTYELNLSLECLKNIF